MPTAAQFAGDPAALRRELSRRVRERMSDRADAGMAADPVRCGGWELGCTQLVNLQVLSWYIQCNRLSPPRFCPAGAAGHAGLPRPLLHQVL